MGIELKECHYCGSYTKNENSYYDHEMYEITNTTLIQGFGYSYRKSKIRIPRCKSCDSKHYNTDLLVGLIPFIILELIFIKLFHIWWDLENFEWLTLLPSSIFSLILAWAISKIFGAYICKKIYNIKNEDEIEDYPEVKGLLDLGWKLEKPATSDVFEEDISKTSPHKKD